MSFVNAHFVTYAQDLGYSPLTAAFMFSIIGATSIIGALLLGHYSDKYGRRVWLAISYQLRAMGFVVVLLSMGLPFLGIPSMGIVALVAGVLLVGLSWNAVVGITAAYTADNFGTAHMGKIYGTMFRRHAHRLRPRLHPRRHDVRHSRHLRLGYPVQYSPADSLRPAGALHRRPASRPER